MLTVHHLNFSRSSRIIWACEELQVPYHLVFYQRTPQFRAPDELKAIHPLGKAPAIVDGDLLLAESGVILDYINVRYGEGRLAPPAGSDDAWRHAEWLHYAESSAGLPIMTTLLGAMTGGLPPGLAGFADAELTRTLDHAQAGLGDGPHLLGEQFTLADIQLAYLLTLVRSVGRLTGHPGLGSYLERLERRPAFQRTLEVGGPITPPR